MVVVTLTLPLPQSSLLTVKRGRKKESVAHNSISAEFEHKDQKEMQLRGVCTSIPEEM